VLIFERSDLFLPFDIDALSSAAIVLILVGYVCLAVATSSSLLESAFEVLKEAAARGSAVAKYSKLELEEVADLVSKTSTATLLGDRRMQSTEITVQAPLSTAPAAPTHEQSTRRNTPHLEDDDPAASVSVHRQPSATGHHGVTNATSSPEVSSLRPGRTSSSAGCLYPLCLPGDQDHIATQNPMSSADLPDASDYGYQMNLKMSTIQAAINALDRQQQPTHTFSNAQDQIGPEFSPMDDLTHCEFDDAWLWDTAPTMDDGFLLPSNERIPGLGQGQA